MSPVSGSKNTLCIKTSLFKKAGFASSSVPLSAKAAVNSSESKAIVTSVFVSVG